MLVLERIKRTDLKILDDMKYHYSQPKGFVGRNICYSINYNGVYYGSIVGGSATLYLPGRNDYFDINKEQLNNIVNNIFFHIEKKNDNYPKRWFSVSVLKEFRNRIIDDWYKQYKDKVIGFESLVELPRSGDCYKRDGWLEVGKTIGYTCKREGGKGTDSWSGKRVWNTKELRPKLVFVRHIE